MFKSRGIFGWKELFKGLGYIEVEGTVRGAGVYWGGRNLLRGPGILRWKELFEELGYIEVKGTVRGAGVY